MKINWREVERSFGIHSKIVDECKDTDYDVDGGFWDNISDWFWGEDFDYISVDKAVGNFYNCCTRKLVQVRVVKIKYRVRKSIRKIFLKFHIFQDSQFFKIHILSNSYF